jgi:hypothetical protein
MGSGSEKGESIATDPHFAMYHQLSLLTGSLPLDRAARQKRSCRSGCRGTPVAFPPFLLQSEESMDNTTLLIVIIVVILLLGGGGWYGRGRWF